MKESCRFVRVRTCAFAGLIALVTLTIPHESWAGDSAGERVTLKGVIAVYVIVEDLSQQLKESGLSTTTLRTDAELRLRSAGIRVATESERFALPGGPYLYVNVTGHQVKNIGGYMFGYSASVEVSFLQNVRLERDSSISTVAPTWSTERVAYGPSTDFIRSIVRDLTDEFANAYLSVNPK